MRRGEIVSVRAYGYLILSWALVTNALMLDCSFFKVLSNAHAFRHTMASMLYFNGADSVSISKRLGHAQVSTTANIYAHIIEAADKKNADILADVFLKKA